MKLRPRTPGQAILTTDRKLIILVYIIHVHVHIIIMTWCQPQCEREPAGECFILLCLLCSNFASYASETVDSVNLHLLNLNVDDVESCT